MIELFPKDKYNITILLLEKSGGFLDSVPVWVKVKNFQQYQNIKSIINESPTKVLFEHIKSLKFFKAIILFFLFLISRLKKDRTMLFSYLLRGYKLKEEYDIAVAYAGPMDFISFFVAKKINAKKRIQWVHFDITKIGFNHKFSSKYYKMFDKILVVSEEGKNMLNDALPELKRKTEVFLNVLNSKKIKELADNGESFKDDFNGSRILTVGRLSKEKGQDLAIRTIVKLKQEGFNIRWYCIGEGYARKEYEELIRINNVEDDFILLGSKQNPYPFMKHCDIYIQPSRHEGYCITLAEAKCFNKPIVSTNFTGAKEQLTHGQTGLIVEVDDHQIYHAIKLIVTNQEVQMKLKTNLQNENKNYNSEPHTIGEF
ncbi:glycosyltransferase involved in cell wall biosynthesis [Mesobacillus foraminis]|uniref:Glycosyltransferase involved in cell wall biosynthesis n=2 Tax=Mesobacillus foraminis TaxID=279826 RepID=A0A4V2RCU3_9BACI|nr:glycosyltransferase involved in cell wall biosynthesis [Mesobacillus foraminis]